jgi:septum formation protein
VFPPGVLGAIALRPVPDLPTWRGVTRRLILASASPARLRVLRWAGLQPEVVVSGVDEDGVDSLPVPEQVTVLARRKATAVAARFDPTESALIIGCDSLLEFDGRAEGKPAGGADAAALWRRMRTRTGLLHTGHCLIDTARGREAWATDTALIRFGDPTDAEIDAYVRTGEPLQVAGAFTLEGFGAAWIDSIDGNYGTITGLSIPVLRRLLRQLGVELVGLWASHGRPDLASPGLASPDLDGGQPSVGQLSDQPALDPSAPDPHPEAPPPTHPVPERPESDPSGG